jgi:hypothetical protein
MISSRHVLGASIGAIARIMAALLVLTIAATASAQAPAKSDVTGTWTFTVTTSQGSGTPTVTFKQQGDSLTGHYSSQTFGEVDFKGTIKDAKIAFSFGTQVQGYDVNVTYAGTVENADSMKGTMSIAGLGEGTFTAARRKQP